MQNVCQLPQDFTTRPVSVHHFMILQSGLSCSAITYPPVVQHFPHANAGNATLLISPLPFTPLRDPNSFFRQSLESILLFSAIFCCSWCSGCRFVYIGKTKRGVGFMECLHLVHRRMNASLVACHFDSTSHSYCDLCLWLFALLQSGSKQAQGTRPHLLYGHIAVCMWMRKLLRA